MLNLSEKTHTLLQLTPPAGGRPYSAILRESVRLIREEQNQHHCLYVLNELDASTELFELREQLRNQGINPEVSWCNREELAKISQQFSDSSESVEGASDFQNLILSIIAEATSMRGSDIHIRIESKYTRVLYRVDGNLRPMNSQSAEWGTRLVNALYNSMCEEQSKTTLSFTEPCDARVREEFVNGYGLSTIRFASRPGGHGRLAVALRLVSRRKQSLHFEQLGLTPTEETTLRRLLTGSGGVFYSGPTGHGKSTVCQVSAEFLAREDPGENILSVEDPIESPIEGVFQTPLGLQTFALAIKNLLRMDPDRLYVGEIRDTDSANGVIEAIQTGAGVLLTIHTNSATDIPQRLRRLGVDEDLLFDPTIVSGLVGLRLVPLLCDACKVPWLEGRKRVSPVMVDMVETHAQTAHVYLRNPGGCSKCGNSGIHGRTGIFEVIETDNRYMRLYSERGKMAAYLDWIDRGGVTLCQNLLRLINSGVTDPVWTHRRIINLDRDTRLKAGADL
ncbi:Type II secretory pathway ATPase GspE/PulE or T4P pilus assembly pathway ATPase PilB [Kosakonia radicincitans]|uniref:Type II secretory pathway ATPase GspE/PulE or T4P pilus assembly pathway ATPase PilB n=1 Tax=Kosakonia radicincitans TaxID=283686 RepID=A0AAX2EZE9_9ENTR|nr:ATPase, T2SS/T4P/T4SS family [Kosakonia radicincitans]SFF37779.1 Type II secretory pathway ATPase GspE/PulE or T4P pilus assembly pathway ATPase PilB [Kosakonia radicincitans]SFR26184.1 Type II secretory pathway ATPase GspE/PulE or T4P pilus assembly pathway ATPase PilB [Kosakonia radicincitans]SFU16671.1 Type II secretory pathway ATPase GspE/PulE or T4P pilus assembly pathway ATPase PilB [Kosakonia radicincitans]SFY31860.1 Type II secretory pathway ATPase GspE/PulE or T4P pilus assembly pat